MALRSSLLLIILSGLAFGQSIPAKQDSASHSQVGPLDTNGEQPSIDFLAGSAIEVFTMAVADVYSAGTLEPIGTQNDGFGILTSLDMPPGLESIFLPHFYPHTRYLHTGRLKRDNRVADFDNDGFPDVISNTYDCVDLQNPDDVAKLYHNNGDGTFAEVSSPFKDLNGNPIEIRGRGETIVVADFNNDGFLDIFIPFYTYTTPVDPDCFNDPTCQTGTCPNSPQAYLLINDGTGHFTDVADAAGVSLRNLSHLLSAEGGQALDFNGDGLIDFYAGSHLFINTGVDSNGIPHFVDQGPAMGLPQFHDEGVKFIDFDNSGYLSLVLFGPSTGPLLYRYNGSTFTYQPDAFPAHLQYSETFGGNAYDIDNDGLDDVLVVGGTRCDPKIFLNSSGAFQRVHPLARGFTLDKSGDPLQLLCNGAGGLAFGDFDNDGLIDVAYAARTQPALAYFKNNTATTNGSFVVEVLGPNGEHNQQGRVVRASPRSHPDVVMTRVVDSGSGYLAQNQYPLLIGTPYMEPHMVTVLLPSSVPPQTPVTISFTISPGQKAQVFAPSTAHPGGMVTLNPVRPFTFDAALYPAAQWIW
jgi:hypothetical protein